MRRSLILLAGLLLLGCGGREAVKAPVLRFTAIPDQNTTELVRKFEPVAAYLSAKLGVPVEYVPSRDYAASVEMFVNGDVLLAWFGGLTGVQARHRRPGAKAIAQGETDPTFYSYFIAHRDSGLTPGEGFPEGLATKRFTFGSASSTSGRLMPEYFLLEATGKTAREFFAEPPGFSGSHPKTAELVASGRYEAGAVNHEAYDRLVAEGKIDPEVCRVIWKTPTYADYNLTAHPDLETRFRPGFTEEVRRAFLAMDDPALLTAFGRKRMIAASDGDFAGIAEVAKKLDMLR